MLTKQNVLQYKAYEQGKENTTNFNCQTCEV